MWHCLLCRPFKSDRDPMNRWEQAHQIWAGSVNPARVDWHTNQPRTEWECVFVTSKLSVPLNIFGKSLFCSSVFNDYLLHSEREKQCFLLFQQQTKETKHCMSHVRETKDLIQQFKWRGSRFKRAREESVLLVGKGGGSGRRRRVATKSLQLVEEAQQTSAPQCLLDIQCD